MADDVAPATQAGAEQETHLQVSQTAAILLAAAQAASATSAVAAIATTWAAAVKR